MLNANTALANYLVDPMQQDIISIDLYTFALSTGETLRYTSGAIGFTVPNPAFPANSINAGANRVFSLGPGFGRSRIGRKVGVQPSNLEIEVQCGPNDKIGTRTFADAARLGYFDGATVELDRFISPTGPSPTANPILPDTSLGALIWFYGRVADIQAGRSKVVITVKSLVNLLEIQQMPRRLYQAQCNHIFGDAMCGYDRVAGKNALGASTGLGQVTVSALAGSSATAVVTTFSPSPSTAYNQGTIIGATGANANFSRTILTVSGGTINVTPPWLENVSIGDTFYVQPGCDHTLSTCINTFINGATTGGRFGGFPYIPPPELAV